MDTYAFGNLYNFVTYMISPHHASYSFILESKIAPIPQTEIQPYNFTATASIIDTWYSEGIYITFNDDGSYLFYGYVGVDPTYTNFEEGTYTISGNQLTFSTDGCEDGVYKYFINENLLSFVDISDICGDGDRATGLFLFSPWKRK